MHSWPREQRLLFFAAVAVFLASILAVGLRAEFGAVGDWGCAWRIERGREAAPNLTGRTLGDARAQLDRAHPCVGLRVVGDLPPDDAPAVVRSQSPAPGEPLDARRLDVVLG